MLIRTATLQDAREIAEVHVRSWQAAYIGILPAQELASLSVDEREHLWIQILSQTEGTTLVLVDGDRVVGWAGFGPARNEDSDLVSELSGIYLLPEYWGLGRGRKIYEAIEAKMRRRPIESIVLWVFEKNIRARRFYETVGFQLEHGKFNELTYAGTQATAVRYRKLIGPRP